MNGWTASSNLLNLWLNNQARSIYDQRTLKSSQSNTQSPREEWQKQHLAQELDRGHDYTGTSGSGAPMRA